MYLSLRYTVFYKESPAEFQQKVSFPKSETANAFALAIEKNGGIAVVVPEYIKTL